MLPLTYLMAYTNLLMKSVFISLIFLILSTNVFALVGSDKSFEEIVNESDVIVIGKQQNISYFVKNGIIYGRGEILVEEVIFENINNKFFIPHRKGDIIQLEWNHPEGLICFYSPVTKYKSVWILKFTNNSGIAKADEPGSVGLVEIYLEKVNIALGRVNPNETRDALIRVSLVLVFSITLFCFLYHKRLFKILKKSSIANKL